ncbi:hypothetical protein [Mycobacterium asiaticum]|uniref:hypothetical protein n=1 Tax=Mycobacterium asiaticum TaxID=1790 RepID=UPI0012DB507B|nr:hypothetical protein [Mycobacterium asiaticum]
MTPGTSYVAISIAAGGQDTPGLPRFVYVHVPYRLPSQIGPPDTLLDVHSGQLVELEYKAPLWATVPVR